MTMGKCLPSKWTSPNMSSGEKKKKHHLILSTLLFMHFSTTIGSFVSGTVLDAWATKVSKIRHLLSKSSHHLIGGQDRHSQLTVIIARTEVATRTNSLRQEQ